MKTAFKQVTRWHKRPVYLGRHSTVNQTHKIFKLFKWNYQQRRHEKRKKKPTRASVVARLMFVISKAGQGIGINSDSGKSDKPKVAFAKISCLFNLAL